MMLDCRRLAASAAAATAIAALLGALPGAAFAAPGQDKARAERNHQPAAAAAEGVKLCGLGVTTSVTDATPPDDEDVDTNMVVLSTTLTKRCEGVLVASFSSEVYTPKEGDFIHTGMFAVCVNKAGLDDACTPGDRLYASPGHTYFRNTVGLPQTHSFMSAWSGLKPGKWRIEVEAGGNASAKLGYRTLKAEAYSKR